MTGGIPKCPLEWLPKPGQEYGHRVGEKCQVLWRDVRIGGLLEAGGVMPLRGKSEAEIRALEEDGFALRDGGGNDTSQARVFFRCDDNGLNPSVEVVLPDDAPFRACRKGLVKGRSKCFDDEGNPVPQVRLLHALKTRLPTDRLRAVEALPPQSWGTETFGQMFSLINDVTRSDEAFRIFVGEQMARAAAMRNGLADWALWENVADNAAEFTLRRFIIDAGLHRIDNNGLFIQAVKETTLEFRGLPAQSHVRSRWEELGGIGNWKEIRRTLGFEWLPPEKDWKKSWKPLLAEKGD